MSGTRITLPNEVMLGSVKELLAEGSRVIIMTKGIVEQVATPQEAYYYPNSKFVADFIGECNFLKAKVTGQDQVEII